MAIYCQIYTLVVFSVFFYIRVSNGLVSDRNNACSRLDIRFHFSLLLFYEGIVNNNNTITANIIQPLNTEIKYLIRSSSLYTVAYTILSCIVTLDAFLTILWRCFTDKFRE